MTRQQYAAGIAFRLSQESERLAREFGQAERIPSTYIDNLLPEAEVTKAYREFPDAAKMRHQNSIREKKYTLKELKAYPRIEEMLYAFQEPEVLSEISRITGIRTLLADPMLYAGGISRMDHGNFLEPHLDNSHDVEQKHYRVLNLLYYITPDWTHESGGNFELWDTGPKGKPREIVSAFNRLLIMATHDSSWHSVSQVREKRPRCCISNYYFSPDPLNHPYFHVTSFRGRPEQPIRDLALRLDAKLRMGLRKVVKRGIHLKPQVRSDVK